MLVSPPNAHHHPPGTTPAEAKLFELGRVNDDVRQSTLIELVAIHPPGGSWHQSTS
jgi:hypothetical protein